MAWLIENLGTIIASVVLIAAILLIAVKLIKDNKKGKLSCGCNCAHCAMTGYCHAQYDVVAGTRKVKERRKISGR